MTRSLWKGPFVDFFFKKLAFEKTNLEISAKTEISSLGSSIKRSQSRNSEKVISKKIWSRRSVILPHFIDRNFEVHNGKQFIKLKVLEDMVGHKFGEFALTRKKPRHIVPKGRKIGSSR
jgi:small subunit ribosomal protein S19